MELSEDCDSGKIQDAKEVVDALISRLKDFTSHSEIEVQERVSLRGTQLGGRMSNVIFRPQTQ